MHLTTLQEELQQFDDYKDLLASYQQISDNSVSFTTLEGDHHTTTLTKDGWLVDPEQATPGRPQQHYETVEALLMAQSDQFRARWSDLLAAKLWEYADKK